MRGGPQSPTVPKGDFHLGSVTYNLLKDYDLETIIRTLETVGYEVVELRTGHKHGVEPSIHVAERARVRRRFEASKVRLLSYGTTCRFQSPDPAGNAPASPKSPKASWTWRTIPALSASSSSPWDCLPTVPQETATRYFGASMRQLGEYGAGKGVEIWMEVHGNGTQNPPVAVALLRAAGHDNVGACWNSNPTDVQNGSVKESFTCSGLDPQRTPARRPTDDRYPFRELFALLRESGYNRYTLAEVAESKETERYMLMFKALWTEMKRPSCA